MYIEYQCVHSIFRAVLGRVLNLIAGCGPGVMSHDVWQHCSLLSGCGLVPQQPRGPGSSSECTHTHSHARSLSLTDGQAKQDMTTRQLCNPCAHSAQDLLADMLSDNVVLCHCRVLVLSVIIIKALSRSC